MSERRYGSRLTTHLEPHQEQAVRSFAADHGISVSHTLRLAVDLVSFENMAEILEEE